jgi:hypothetical protein
VLQTQEFIQVQVDSESQIVCVAQFVKITASWIPGRLHHVGAGEVDAVIVQGLSQTAPSTRQRGLPFQFIWI